MRRSSERCFRGRWLRPVLAPAAVDAALSPSTQGGVSGFSASRSPARSWARRPASWRRPRPSRPKAGSVRTHLRRRSPRGQSLKGRLAPKRGARDQKRRAGVWFARRRPSPTLVRTSARARSTDQASRTPRGFADASSIIPSGRSGREDKGAWPSSGEAVLELADAGDRDPDRVAALQELRRGKADADAGRRAGRDEVARLKRQPGRDRLR